MAEVVEISLVDEPTSPLARIRGLVSDTPKLLKRALTGAGRPSSHPAAADLARLRRSFDLFDADKSGGIDVGELQDCLASLGHDLTDEILADLSVELAEVHEPWMISTACP